LSVLGYGYYFLVVNYPKWETSTILKAFTY